MKKKVKKCFDVDDEEGVENKNKVSPVKKKEPSSTPIDAPEPVVPVDPLADEAPITPVVPTPPPATASKEQKLKYLEDLEKNLEQTKEKVKFPSPSGSVALNSPITVPIAEFSAMVSLLALISLGGRLLELASHGSELYASSSTFVSPSPSMSSS